MLHPHPLRRPTSSSVNPRPGTSPLGHVRVSSASACAMLGDHSRSTPAMHTMPVQLTHAPVKPQGSALIPFYNVPPPRGQARLHLIAFLGHRLPSQTNTSLFYVLCPHSCAPGRTSRSVTHRPRPSTLNLGVLKRWASRKEVATYWYEYPINPIKP